jgi:hypothetical protein
MKIMKQKLFLTLIIYFVNYILIAQNAGLVNGDRLVVGSGNYIVIPGNYNNLATGVLEGSGQINLSENWTNNGSTNPNSISVLFNGNNNQSISSSSSPENIYNLIVNKSSGSIILNNATRINNTLTLQNGIINSTTVNLLKFQDNATATGASNNSYVNGPVEKTGNDAFIFPIGKASKYLPLGITAPSNVNDVFIAEYFASTAVSPNQLSPQLEEIDSCEYWQIAQSNGNSNVKITLSWNSQSCNITPALSRIAIWNNNQWENMGSSSYTGNVSSGSVTSNNNYSSAAYGTGNRQITIGTEHTGYAKTKKELDGGLYYIYNNKLKIKSDELYENYSPKNLIYRIYNSQRELIASVNNAGSQFGNSPLVNVKYRDNYIVLDLSALNITLNKIYFLEVENRKGEIEFLKFSKKL